MPQPDPPGTKTYRYMGYVYGGRWQPREFPMNVLPILFAVGALNGLWLVTDGLNNMRALLGPPLYIIGFVILFYRGYLNIYPRIRVTPDATLVQRYHYCWRAVPWEDVRDFNHYGVPWIGYRKWPETCVTIRGRKTPWPWLAPYLPYLGYWFIQIGPIEDRDELPSIIAARAIEADARANAERQEDGVS